MGDVAAQSEGPAERARTIAAAGGLEAALAAGLFVEPVAVSLSEGLVLGLMRQGVTRYFAIFGHGSTALAEVLRHYEAAGLVRVWQFRNEIEMAHAATALRWIYGENAAVVTSIGPGALQAMAASLAASSNGVGVYHIYGDETTHGEGYNMQQIPKPQQGLFGVMTAAMSRSYTLHTPEALREALRQGAATVFHPYKPMPFFLLAPINTQPKPVTLRIASLPTATRLEPQLPAIPDGLDLAIRLVAAHDRVVVKAGGGTRRFARELRRFAELIEAPVVLGPGTVGVLPDAHPLNLHVGGSKGSISGNFAMEEAELLIAVGTRAVCQSDCSGLGYPKVREVININADVDDVQHYNHTLPLFGDIGAILDQLSDRAATQAIVAPSGRAQWLSACREKKAAWMAFRAARCDSAPLFDPVWQRRVLTQPAAIATVDRFAREVDALKVFDAGDVQANGFQIVEDDAPLQSITESGASYMGFAVSALLSAVATENRRYAIALTGDGSFMMNPQVLIDGVEHGIHATIVVFDNRRMAAITGLQLAQYGTEFRTSDSVSVDYRRLASAVDGVLALWGGTTREELATALGQAHAHPGLSLIHLPVHHGAEPESGMGAYGRWNVGNWVDAAEADYVRAGL